MGKNNVDKTVKDKLYNLNTPIETNLLWDNIQNKMGNEDQDSDKEPIPIFWLPILIGITAVSLFLLSPSISNSSSDNLLSSNNNEQIENTNNDVNQSLTETVTPNTLVAEQSQSSTGSTKKIETANQTTTKNNTANKNKIAQSQISEVNTSYSNDIQSRTTQTTSSHSNRSNTNNTNNNFTKNNTSSESKITASTEIYKQQKSSLIASNTSTSSDQSNNAIASLDDSALFTSQSSKSNAANNSMTSMLAPLDGLHSYLLFEGEKVNPCGDGKRDKVQCYDTWQGKKIPLSILAYGGVDLVTNNATSTEETHIDYLNERKSSMKFLEVLKAGVLLKYKLNQNVYVKAGVHYDQINEKFEHVETKATEAILPNQVIAYRINMEGDTIPVTGDGPVTIIETTTWRKYNKYHSFNVPLLVGYQQPFGKFVSWYGEAGIFYNFRFNYEGTLLNENYEVVNGENFFSGNTGTSIYAAAGLTFHLTRRWDAFANASYRYNLKSINNVDFNPVKQNLGLTGLAIGMEYHF